MKHCEKCTDSTSTTPCTNPNCECHETRLDKTLNAVAKGMEYDRKFMFSHEAVVGVPSPEVWENKVIPFIKEYACQEYLVSEENHPVEDEIRALGKLLFEIGNQIEASRSSLLDSIEAMVKRMKGKCPCVCGCGFKDGCLCRRDYKGWDKALSAILEELKDLQKHE